MILADKIIDLRKKAGWSQEELAEKLGVSRQSVSKWEGAQSIPDMNKILQLSELFGVSTDYLLKDSMEAADALRNTVLYAAREDFHLAEGQYFISDAIGLPVLDAREGREGRVLGVVEDILPNAASDIYSVKTPDGGEVLVPALPVFIEDVIPGECVRMTPIDGRFENTDDAEDKENG